MTTAFFGLGPTTGTYAERVALASPQIGQLFYQTDTDEYVKYVSFGGANRWMQAVLRPNRNRFINGSLDVWARGNSFTPANNSYAADRWNIQFNGAGATRTVSRQLFTPGNPIAGAEPTYYCRFAQSVAGTSGTYNMFSQHIEDARSFAGQTVTVSFWAKADAARDVALKYSQLFGSGGSAAIYDVALGSSNTVSLTTSWQRFSITGNIASISGKSVSTGADSSLRVDFNLPINATFVIDLWGIQIEAGSAPSEFEFEDYVTTLRKCQRYYYRITTKGNYGAIAVGMANAVNSGVLQVPLPTEMRASPTSVEFANLRMWASAGGAPTLSTIVMDWGGTTVCGIFATATSSLYANGAALLLQGNNTTGAYLALSAEF